MMFKWGVLFLLFLTANVKLYAQQIDYIDRFVDNLKSAETFEDTLLSVISLKMLNKKHPVENAEILKKSLNDIYPDWIAFECEIINTNDEDVKINWELQEIHPSNEKLNSYYNTITVLLNSEQKDYDNIIDWNYKSNPSEQALFYYFNALKYTNLGETDSIIQSLHTVHEVLPEASFPIFQINCLLNELRHRQGKRDSTDVALIHQGIAMSEAIPEYYFRAMLYNLLQNYYKFQGQTQKAIEAGQMFLTISQKIGDTHGTIIAYLNQSTYLQEQGQFDQAYSLIDKAKKLCEEKQDTLSINSILTTEANLKMNEKKYDEAIALLKTAIHNAPDSYRNKPISILNIIESYYTVGKLDSAYLYFNELVRIDPEDSQGMHAYAKTFIAQYMVESGQFVLAQEYIEDAYKDARAYNDLSSESIVHLAQSKLYESKGQYQEALDYFKKHMSLEQDFRNEDKAAEVTRAQMNFEFTKEKELIALENETEKLRIKNQRNNAIFLGLLSLIIALSGLMLYFTTRKKNKKISEQNIKLDNLNSIKDTLFQIIGHDLKKPSLAFKGIGENIKYLLKKGDHDKLIRMSDEIEKDAIQFYNLTDNLLNWASQQKDIISLQPENLNLAELVNENIESLKYMADAKGLTVKNNVSDHISIFADKEAIMVIIRNLYDNAIKYSLPNGKIDFNAVVINNKVKFDVKDYGQGMAPNRIVELMSKDFIKSQVGTNSEKGSGLGLNIVKNFIKKINGEFDVQSELGKGSTFSFLVPNVA